MDADTARVILTVTGVLTSASLLWCAIMLTNIRDHLKNPRRK